MIFLEILSIENEFETDFCSFRRIIYRNILLFLHGFSKLIFLNYLLIVYLKISNENNRSSNIISLEYLVYKLFISQKIVKIIV
jgi:hypothetical protein